MRNGRSVFNVANFNSSRGQGADRRFTTRTGSAHPHFDTAYAVITRHAGGVLGRLLGGKGRAFARSAKTQRPGLFQARTFPAWSAIVTMVLLNEAWMWAMPCGTCFRSFFLKVFFLPFFSGVAAPVVAAAAGAAGFAILAFSSLALWVKRSFASQELKANS